MTYICTRPKGSCSNCEHYRFDDDYGSKCCWAVYDKKDKKKPSPAKSEGKPTEVFNGSFKNSNCR